jgi:hypothetical protein
VTHHAPSDRDESGRHDETVTRPPDSAREKPDLKAIIKKNLLCFALGKIPSPLLTITEKVEK